MNDPSPYLYEFGSFRLDPQERLLWQAGEIVWLTPKAFDTLLALLEKSGQVLSKDELMNRIWPNTYVEEANLAQNISTLRKALGESTDGVKYIETLPRRGYRFIAPVQKVPVEQEAKPVEAETSFPVAATPTIPALMQPSTPAPSVKTLLSKPRRWKPLLAGLLVLLVLFAVGIIFASKWRAEKTQ